MIDSSALATLLIASRLSLDSSAGTEATDCDDGVDDRDDVGDMQDQTYTVDKIFQGASIALAVAFSVSAHLDPTDRADGETGQTVEHGYHAVDNNNVTALWDQRPRFPRRMKLSNLFQAAEEWEDVPVLQGCDASQDLLSTPSAKIREPQKISTRRQRRSKDKSRCNYSDFCDNDLSRQIEGMVMEVETAYANRHVKKSKHVIAQTPIQASIKKEEKVCTTGTSVAMMKDEELFTPTKNLLQVFNLVGGKTAKTISLSPSPPSIKSQLHHAGKPTDVNDGVPQMTPCDSLASLSSDYSIGSTSSLSSFGVTPQKKTWNFSRQRNADWSILE